MKASISFNLLWHLNKIPSSRTLSEFWHWFVANIPGDSVDDGEVVFELLFPLVLPEGDGDHRYGFFVFEQPGQLNYQVERSEIEMSLRQKLILIPSVSPLNKHNTQSIKSF